MTVSRVRSITASYSLTQPVPGTRRQPVLVPVRVAASGSGSAGFLADRTVRPVAWIAFRDLIVGLLGVQREDHLLAVVVIVDDLGPDRLAERDHIRRLADPVRSEPADMYDALGSVSEINVGK
jgi:hypothetical protein